MRRLLPYWLSWPGDLSRETSLAQTRDDFCVSTFACGRVLRPREREEVPMPIVGGLDIHRKQITFDYLDTATGEVHPGQLAPADRGHLAGWLAGRFTGQDAHFAVEGCTGWRVCGRRAGRGRDHRACRRAGGRRRAAGPQAARQHRPDRFAAPAGAAGLTGGCRNAGSAVACPGTPGAARAVSRPAHRAHRLGAADPRGAVPPGRPGPRRGRAAHRRGPGRAAGDRRPPAVAGRAAADRGGPGQARRAGGPS